MRFQAWKNLVYRLLGFLLTCGLSVSVQTRYCQIQTERTEGAYQVTARVILPL